MRAKGIYRLPSYWFDVFTRETWVEARENGFSTSGFSETKRVTASRVQPGDILICYVRGEKKLVGALRVTGPSYFAREPRIWKSQEFPVRVPAEPLVILDRDQEVSIAPVLPQLSFYDPDSIKKTYARFQGSPTPLADADGELMLMAVQSTTHVEASTEGTASDGTTSTGASSQSATPEEPTADSGATPRLLSTPLDNLVAELEAAQRDATHPQRFEQAVTEAFAFLGFDAQWHGRSGETDVVVESPLGHDRFRAVLDAKASGSGKISENQINWPAVAGHRQRMAADHAAIVGERFAGGNLQTFAVDFSIALIDTESLIEVLRLHLATPFQAGDLRPLFSTTGPMSAVIADLRQKAQSLQRHWRLIGDIIRLIDGFSRMDPPLTPTPGNLHAVLVSRALGGRDQKLTPPSEQEVRDAVAFLACRAVGVLRAVDPDTAGYRLTMSIHSTLQRLRALDRDLRDILASEDNEPAEQPGTITTPPEQSS